MGRELKRVSLNFNWQKGKVWEGYVNPFYKHRHECKFCEGSTLNEATKKISDDWYSFGNAEWIDVNSRKRYNNLAWSNHLTDIEVDALMKSGRLGDISGFNGWFDEEEQSWFKFENGGQVKCDKPKYPSAEEVNKWNRESFGHDSLNQWICVKARANHLGVFGKCEHCNEEGYVFESEELKKKFDEWEEFDPPKGEGYQLWETTSEGSPSSPVFETLDALCEWCEKNATTFADYRATKDEWKKMFGEDNVHHQEGNLIFI